jgi:hypothetical protein
MMMTNRKLITFATFILMSRSSISQTMSVNVNGFAQHMVSYYSVADVLNGRLRTPSSIGELVSLEISPEYMQKQNFRFPPVFDIGPDGLLQYK